MDLIRLINRESPLSVKQLSAMAMLSGLANAMVLTVINSAAGVGHESLTSFRYVLLFAVTVTVYIRAQSYLMVRSATVVESILHGMRCRFVDLIRSAGRLPLDTVGRSAIHAGISGELAAISQATTEIVTASQASIMVVCAISYLALLSWTAFLITLCVSAIGISIHFQKARERQADIQESTRRETGFLDLFTQLLNGFNEVKVNRRIGDELAKDLMAASNGLRDIKVRVSTQFSGHFVFSQAIFYLMLAAIVFLLPRFNEQDPMLLTKTTSTILFIIGPLTAIMAAIPSFTMANVAVLNIQRLEGQLADATETPLTSATLAETPSFATIALQAMTFRYPETASLETFGIGPIDLHVKAGETIFIVGGNGSGKTTFLRLLTGLYYPKAGALLLDGKRLTPQTIQEYRNLFSIIFTDYHLFSRVYGVERIDAAELEALLLQFELQAKTSLGPGNQWSSISLSSGQRKRLALIVSILQRKPVIVFDEWAADQDPTFRRYFYEVLLPELKAAGKTIIAATHDDRYFHIADRVLRMEFGHLEPWEGSAAPKRAARTSPRRSKSKKAPEA